MRKVWHQLRRNGFDVARCTATNQICLAIRNVERGGRTVRERVADRNQLAIMLTGRFDA